MTNHKGQVKDSGRLAVIGMALVLAFLVVLVSLPVIADGVGISDPGLEEAIRNALGFSDEVAITTSDLQGLKELDATDYGIRSLDGIQACENLTELTLWFNDITDITPLSNLKQLKYLDLDNNNVADLSPLAKLAHLETLYASYNPITDLSPLSGISTLQLLFIDYVEVANWGTVEQLTSLSKLSADGNGIKDVSLFAKLELLTVLYLASNAIVDVSPLGMLSNLEVLVLADNGIEVIDALASLDQLCALELSRNLIRDIAVFSEITFSGNCGNPHVLVLADNLIADISPLSAIAGLDIGDSIDLRGNPAVENSFSVATADTLRVLDDKGIRVQFLLPLEEGIQAPDFILSELDSGRTVTLSSLSPKVVILDFWASWCGYCRETLPEIDRIAGEFAEDVILLGVNLDRDEANAWEFLLETPAPNMTTLRGTFEEANAVSLMYGDLLMNGIPYTYIIDPSGVIAFSGHPSEITEQMIRDLLPQTVSNESNPNLQNANQHAIVSFPDPGLEAAIRDEIGKPSGDILNTDLDRLTSLFLMEHGISNLEGIQHCTNLTELDLEDNQIVDISPLAGLINLTRLGLYDNQIVDISPLAGLFNLMELSLSGNQIVDISPLAGLINLTRLVLDRNQIVDISPLAGSINLMELSLSGNQIVDITPLAGLINLTELLLVDNQIIDISPLAGLINLMELWLAYNQIVDITPLVINVGIDSDDFVIVSENYLDLIPGSQDMLNIQTLQARGVDVLYHPRN